MKQFFLANLVLIFFAVFAQAQTFYGVNDVKTFREGRDKEFRNLEESPLLSEDFLKFKGLKYFPTDEKLSVEARFEKTAGEQFFIMPTSVGTSVKFIKYGVLTFDLVGKSYTLTVYQSENFASGKFPEYKDLLFIPFRDLTNGTETYGAGRYLDIKIPADNEAVLNFNLAYNPNCAYGSSRYACPVPPKENFLRLKVTAGEKKFVSPNKKIAK